jgi:hypothetical protein
MADKERLSVEGKAKFTLLGFLETKCVTAT